MYNVPALNFFLSFAKDCFFTFVVILKYILLWYFLSLNHAKIFKSIQDEPLLRTSSANHMCSDQYIKWGWVPVTAGIITFLGEKVFVWSIVNKGMNLSTEKTNRPRAALQFSPAPIHSPWTQKKRHSFLKSINFCDLIFWHLWCR